MIPTTAATANMDAAHGTEERWNIQVIYGGLTVEEGGPNGQPDIGGGTVIQTIVGGAGKRPLGPTQRLVRHSAA